MDLAFSIQNKTKLYFMNLYLVHRLGVYQSSCTRICSCWCKNGVWGAGFDLAPEELLHLRHGHCYCTVSPQMWSLEMHGYQLNTGVWCSMILSVRDTVLTQTCCCWACWSKEIAQGLDHMGMPPCLECCWKYSCSYRWKYKCIFLICQRHLKSRLGTYLCITK